MVSPDFSQKLKDRWDELVINNPDITPEMRTQLSQISNEDLKNASNSDHVEYFEKKYPDHIQHPYQVQGSQLLLTISPELSIDIINKYHNDIGITGTAGTFDFRSDFSESLGIETIIHDILSLYALTGEVPGILSAVYPYSDLFILGDNSNIVSSALLVPFYALKEGIIEIIDDLVTPEMIEISGSALGGQLGGYIADNTFASQLLGRSVGSTVGGVVGSAIGYGVIDNQSLEVLATSDRFGSNLISNAVSLSGGEISDYLIDKWKIEDPLAQIAVSTLIQETTSYGVTVSADYLFGDEIAIDYFGSTGDLSIGSFGNQLVNAGASALGGYIGSDLYYRLIDWNVLSERFSAEGVSIGGSLGGMAAGLIGGGTASGTFATGIGSFVVAGSLAGPVGSIVLVAAGTLLGSVIGGMFGDDDLPRAGYSVTIKDGKFVYDFGWDNDGGSAEIAETMAENATDFLNYIASAVGGQVYATGNEFDDIFYYGHYSQDYFYKPLSATPDNAPSGPSEWRYPYLFQSLDEAIITGVVEQIGNAIIEGGDRWQKRALLNTTANNFNDLARDIAVAKEYGIALDNWALQQKFIEDLNNNAISEADEEIIDLRNRPWDVFSPPFNPSNVPDKTYQIPEGFTIDDIQIKLNNSELVIEYGDNNYTDSQWGITQTENRTQYISFSNGDLYAILLIGNEDDESEDESYQSHLVNGERAESIQVINVVDSQTPIPADEYISITREGNDLVITITGGEITPENPDGVVSERVFANAVTNDVAELLRFPDGKILKVIFTDNSLELVKENFPFNLQKIKSSNILDFGLDILPSEVSLSLSGDDLIINGVTYTDWLDEELAEEVGRIELLRFANGNTFKIVVNGNNVELQHEFVANWNEILAQASELNLDAPQASDYYTRANFTPIFDGTPQGGSNGNSELDVPDSYLFTDFSLAVVDLTADGLDLIPATASNIILDLDDDEYLEQMGWISPTDAFLVWDQNNDGLITNFDEYISLTNYTETTFIGSLDSNNDGILNRHDTHFEDLRLWTDNNGNQKVELGEFLALHRIGVYDILLNSQQQDFEVAGNRVTASTYFSQLGYDSRTSSLIYDVSFAYNPDGTKFVQLDNGLSEFQFEDKPSIIVADDTTSALDLVIDPTVNYSVTGGKNNDKLTVINNAQGEVIFNGGEGDDTVIGGAGDDILNGGKGRDVLEGKEGNDVITIDSEDDFRRLDGGEGFDIVALAVENNRYILLGDIHNIETIIGNKLANDIRYGGMENIIISGDNGDDTIWGGLGNDQLEGGDDEDEIYGDEGNDLILGGFGDDRLDGENGDDILDGGLGNDTLVGGSGGGNSGDDTLDGGLGDDHLEGGGGDDTYIFNLGYGQDLILKNRKGVGVGGFDIVKFGAGLTPESMDIYRQERNLIFQPHGSTDRLTIESHFDYEAQIEEFHFDDGAIIWSLDDIQQELIHSTTIDGDDLIYSSSRTGEQKYLQGGLGNDSIHGRDGNDTLDGGLGNDSLVGGSGEDTYIFNLGYGQEEIVFGSGGDVVKFGPGLTPESMDIYSQMDFYEQYDLIFQPHGSTDRLTIKWHFLNYSQIDQFHFDDGAIIWSLDDLKQELMDRTTTDGDDLIVGYHGLFINRSIDVDDTLNGGLGNDSLLGGSGDDTYIFNLGYGQDWIFDSPAQSWIMNTDAVKFGAGLTPESMDTYRQGHNLIFQPHGSTDRLTIESHFSSGNQIEQFHFDDGKQVLSAQQLESQLDLIINIEDNNNNNTYGFVILENSNSIINDPVHRVDRVDLLTTDINRNPNQITYTLTTLPQNGELLLNGEILNLNNTFTQADLNNGLISYQHDGTRSIRDHFGFSVTNQHSTASDQVFDIKIAPVNDAPVVINNQGLTLAPNTTGTITTNHLLTTDEEDTNPNDITYVLDKDVDYGELYLNGVSLEKNDTFTQADIDNNLLTYQHTGTDTTPDSFKVLIRDSENKYIGMTYYYDVMDIITFEINLHEINTAPVINSSNFTIAENQPEIGTIQATDIDGDELTYSITAGSDRNLFQINENTGQLNFINAPDYENPQDNNQDNIYELEITVNDGISDSQPTTILVTVTIDQVNDAPVAVDDIGGTNKDSSTVIEVLANDFDIDDGDVLTVVSVDDGGLEGTVSTDGSTVTYDPNGQFDDLLEGEEATETFSYTISDGNGGSDSAEVTVTILGSGIAVIAVDDTDTTDEKSAVEVDVLGNDSGEGITVTSVDENGLEGTVTIAGDGLSVTYDPNGEFDSLPVGGEATDSFGYTITDLNGDTDSATVTITIDGVNDDPVAVDDQAQFSEDVAVSIDVLANDFDIDEGDVLSIDSFANPANGSVEEVGGELVYTPDAGFSGEDSFTYTITDGNGGFDSANVTINVISVIPEPTVEFSASEYSVGEDVGDSMVVTLTRSGDLGSASEVTVDINITGAENEATPDEDYDASSFPLSVTFDPDQETQVVTVPIFEDGIIEGTEFINFNLEVDSNAVLGDQDTTTLKIFDNDKPEPLPPELEDPNLFIGSEDIDNVDAGSGRDDITGNGGDDIITGGTGSETLTGGAGADRFVYESFRDARDTITDFEVGVDVIDFRAILNTVEPYSRRNPSYLSDDPFEDYLRFESVGADTQVKLDRRGDLGDAFSTMVILESVQPTELTASDFLL